MIRMLDLDIKKGRRETTTFKLVKYHKLMAISKLI